MCVCLCLCFQRECSDWIETCEVLLLDVKRGPVDLSFNPSCPALEHLDPAPNCTDSHQDDVASQQHNPTSSQSGLPPATSKHYSSAPRQPSSASKPLLGDPEVLLSPANYWSLFLGPIHTQHSDDGDVVAVALLQREPSDHDEEEEEGSVSLVQMIGYDGHITERAVGDNDGQPDMVGDHKHSTVTVSIKAT